MSELKPTEWNTNGSLLLKWKQVNLWVKTDEKAAEKVKVPAIVDGSYYKQILHGVSGEARPA